MAADINRLGILHDIRWGKKRRVVLVAFSDKVLNYDTIAEMVKDLPARRRIKLSRHWGRFFKRPYFAAVIDWQDDTSRAYCLNYPEGTMRALEYLNLMGLSPKLIPNLQEFTGAPGD